MIKLILGNSISKIEGLSIEQHKSLSKELSYEVDAQAIFHSGGYKPRLRTLLGAKGDFPTGLYGMVDEYLTRNCHKAIVMDNRHLPASITGLFDIKLGHNPYPEQKAAAKAAKALKRGIITAPTGCGKSLIISLIINELQVSTLVVVPSLELKRQMTESLKQSFGIKKVGGIEESLPIAVENVDSLSMDEVYNYDCVIIDEFHHSAASTYRKLNKKAWNKIYYRFGMTATPFRSQDNERLLLESVLSQVIYRIDYKTAVDKGYIVPMEAYYIEIPTTENIQGNPTSWPSMYSELIVNHKLRNTMITELLVKLHVSKSATLCLVKEISHGQQLSDMTGGAFAHGINEDTPMLVKAFNDRKLTTLIGTNGILGEGVDTKPCEYVIIAGLGKSKNAFMQQCGRAFRIYPGKESAKIIIFKDKSHKWTLKHFKEQCKILLEEYGIKAVKL